MAAARALAEDENLSPLPRSLAPLPEEALTGYLLRLAHRLDRSPARIGRITSLVTYAPSDRTPRLPTHLLLELQPRTANVFSTATRLTADEVSALGLSRHTSSYPPLARVGLQRDGKVRHNAWALSPGNRYCTACLAGNGSPIESAHGGAWRRDWRLPVIFACTRHGQLLEHRCLTCLRPLHGASRGRMDMVLHPGARGIHPTKCRNVLLGSSAGNLRAYCEAPLTQRREDRGPSSSSLAACLGLQKRIEALFLPGCEDPFYFNDLLAVAQLIILAWPASIHISPLDTPLADALDRHIVEARRNSTPRPGAQHGPAGVLGPPTDATATAALLLQSDSLLTDRDPTRLRDAMQSLADSAAGQDRPRFTRMLRHQPGTPSLARALSRQYRGFHAGLRHPLATAALRVPTRDSCFGPEEVPQLISTTWYQQYFSELASRLTVPSSSNADHIRRAAALKLIEMSTGATLVEAAQLLDMPVSCARSSMRQLRQRCPEDAWPLFHSAVEAVAEQLERSPVRHDYARRRRQLAQWTVPAHDWTDLTRGLGHSLTQSHHHVGFSVLAWACATQSYHLFSPLIRDTTTGQRLPGANVVTVAANQLRNAHHGGMLILLGRLGPYADQLGGGL